MASDNPEDEEDDYLAMTFSEPPTNQKETSLQRTTRLKKEAAERGRILSKAELAEKQKAALDSTLATSLDTSLDSSNKGARIMAKMGFTPGSTLGQSSDARKNPIELLMKDDRGGIGMDSEKKRKVREAAEAMEEGEKRQKVSADEFRERSRVERQERRAEGTVWGAMRVLEGFEEVGEVDGGEGAEGEGEAGGQGVSLKGKGTRKLSEVPMLYRPLVKQRLEKDRERRMRVELNNSLSTRNNEDEEDGRDVEAELEYEDDEDEELREFEALPAVERLEKVTQELRSKYFYCFWCKHRYEDAEMEGCPGLTEDEHG